MIIEISFTEPAIQVCHRKMVKGGIILNVYYYGGERYQHYSEISGRGSGEMTLWVYNDNGDEVGNIKITGETEEEKELFNYTHSILRDRDKETERFVIIPNKLLETVKATFKYKRTFPEPK